MSVSSLVGNIGGSISGLAATLGLTSGNSDPNFPTGPEYANVGVFAIDDDVKARWFTLDPNRYSFGVISDGDQLSYTSQGTQALNSVMSLFGAGADGPSPTFTDFALPITPSEINQIEKFATIIKPTQGGTVLQHSGNRYKDLVISGTTGVSPFRGNTGVDPTTGAAIFQPDQLQYRSGYEVFIHFRTWIKAYVESKNIPGNEDLRMVFKNYKDWEFLLVEPLTFTMKRDATRPLLYNYSISFKVLGHYNITKGPLNFLDEIDNGLALVQKVATDARGIMLKFQDVIRSVAGLVDQVSEDLRTITLAVKAAKTIPVTAQDVSTQVENNFVTQMDALGLILKLGKTSSDLASNPRNFEQSGVDLETTPSDPKALSRSLNLTGLGKTPANDPKSYFQNAKNSLGSAVSTIQISDYPLAARNAITLEQSSVATMSRQKVQNMFSRAKELRDKFSDAVGLGDPTYDRIYGATSTQQSAVATSNLDIQFEILYGINQALSAYRTILSTDDMFDTNSQLFAKTDAKSGSNSIGNGIFSFPDPNSGVRERIVPANSTLEDIALIELGNGSRWTELAELNGIKYPFIDNSTTSDTVNFIVNSAGYANPNMITYLQVNDYYLIPSSPVPTGPWTGKGSYITQYLGGPLSNVSSWSFIFPQSGTIVQVKDIPNYFQFGSGSWITISIDDLRTTEVLKPGDIIKIPAGITPPNNTQTRGPRDNAITNGLSSSEKAMSVDLKLNEQGDLDLNPSGDLNLVTGYNNLTQAVVLKLLYEQGTIIKHPEVGTGLQVGNKMPKLSVIRAQITSSLLQDDRIASVKNINLFQNNGVIQVTFDVYAKTINTPIPVTIPVG